MAEHTYLTLCRQVHGMTVKLMAQMEQMENARRTLIGRGLSIPALPDAREETV